MAIMPASDDSFEASKINGIFFFNPYPVDDIDSIIFNIIINY